MPLPRRRGVQFKQMFTNISQAIRDYEDRMVPDPRKPGETWGDYYDARDRDEDGAEIKPPKSGC